MTRRERHRLPRDSPGFGGVPGPGRAGDEFGGKAGDTAWRDGGSETKGAARGHPPPSPHRLAVRHPGAHLRRCSSTGPDPLALDGTRHRRPARPADPPRRAQGPAAAPLDAVRRSATPSSANSSPAPRPRAALDRRPGRGAPPRPAPGRLAARPGLPGQGRRHRGRDPGRLLGRRGRLRARPGPPGGAAVLAGPHGAQRLLRAELAEQARPAPTRSRPPRPGRGATPTWCSPRRCGPG